MSAAETFLSCVLWLVVAFCLDHVHQDFHCIHLLKSTQHSRNLIFGNFSVSRGAILGKATH